MVAWIRLSHKLLRFFRLGELCGAGSTRIQISPLDAAPIANRRSLRLPAEPPIPVAFP